MVMLAAPASQRGKPMIPPSHLQPWLNYNLLYLVASNKYLHLGNLIIG
jgi:hypothetical protein